MSNPTFFLAKMLTTSFLDEFRNPLKQFLRHDTSIPVIFSTHKHTRILWKKKKTCSA